MTMNNVGTKVNARKAALFAGILVIVCCAMTALAGCGSPAQNNQQGSDSQQENDIAVTVTVDSSAADNQASFDGTVDLPADATVFAALEATGLEVKTTSSAVSDYVSSIGGLAEKDYGDMSGWVFTVNDEQVTESADQCTLEDGDTVKWEYLTSFE